MFPKIRSPQEVYEEGDEQTREIYGLTVERRDPYGFWYIQKAKHPRLQGAFTNLDQVENAILTWFVKPKQAAEATKAERL